MQKFDRFWWTLPFWINAVPFGVLMLLDMLSGHGTNTRALADLRTLRAERRAIHKTAG